jgi:amino acid transporter
MIWAIVLNGTTGFIMTVTFAYCIGPLDAAIQPPYFFAFIGTFYNATGSKAGATVMTCIITLLTLCSAISNVATASRQMFAFARDRGLPAADFLSYVRPGWDIPLNSILVSMCITALLSLINLGSTDRRWPLTPSLASALSVCFRVVSSQTLAIKHYHYPTSGHFLITPQT